MYARDLVLIRAVTVDQRLGYSGTRTFHTAAQALQWIKPAVEVFGAFPAESWRIKAFEKALGIADLAECCASFPEEVLNRYATKRGSLRGGFNR